MRFGLMKRMFLGGLERSPFLRPFPIRVNLHCKLCHEKGRFDAVEPRMQKLSLELFCSFNFWWNRLEPFWIEIGN